MHYASFILVSWEAIHMKGSKEVIIVEEFNYQGNIIQSCHLPFSHYILEKSSNKGKSSHYMTGNGNLYTANKY